MLITVTNQGLGGLTKYYIDFHLIVAHKVKKNVGQYIVAHTVRISLIGPGDMYSANVLV